jgi:hypothetical protein
MGLNGLPGSEVVRLNMSASARITQALKVNDIGTAQRIAAHTTMGHAPVHRPAPIQTPSTARGVEHQVDVWA